MSAIVPIVALRLLVPLTIRRWPFWGGIASLVADTIDRKLISILGLPLDNGIEYQSLDKFLDLYYLTFEFFVVSGVKEVMVRRTLKGLFFWRAIGVLVFEATQLRKILFFAPNIFEYLYLVVFWARRYKPSFKIDTPRKLAITIFIIAIPKLSIEYLMHFKEYPLGIGSIWDWLRAWIKL